jgi:hypothetical protein
MKKHPLIVPLMMFLFANGATTQVEHAPTVEQCRADYAVWNVTIGEPANSYNTIAAQVVEMNACFHVDSSRSIQYLDFQNAGNVDAANRLQDFVTRHDLMKQFLAEDSKGLR